MTAERLAQVLGMDEWPAEYSALLERFQSEWETVRTQPLLDVDELKLLVAQGYVMGECLEDVYTCLNKIEEDEELHFAFQVLFYVLCVYRLPSENEFYKEPVPPLLEDYRYTFAMTLLIKILMNGVKKARERGIPEELIAQHKGAANGDRLDGSGPFGAPNMFHWRTVCAFATMYSLGAFRYEPERVPPGYRMLRRRADGKLLMLYTAARDIDEFGQFAWSADMVRFTTKEADGKLDGSVITPDGCMTDRYVSLSDEEWDVAFDGGDTALSFHIPPEIPYNVENAADSFRQAVEFFDKYYPDMNVKSIQSYSWLYSPQLKSMLPETSGINRFNREVYLAPVPSGPDGFYSFVFKTDAGSFDLDTVETNTSLKRGFVSYVKNGGRVHNGVMYLPAADVNRFGADAHELYLRSEE